MHLDVPPVHPRNIAALVALDRLDQLALTTSTWGRCLFTGSTGLRSTKQNGDIKEYTENDSIIE